MSGTNGSPLHVLIAGGGVAALEAVLALRKLAEDRVTIELVAPERTFTYRPLAVAEPFGIAQVRDFPLEPLVAEMGATLRPGCVSGIDPERKRAVTSDGERLGYDVFLLAVGARPRETVPGAVTFAGPRDTRAFGELLDDAVQGEARRIAFALPRGVAWPLPLYELALLTWSFLVDRGALARELTIVTPESSPLSLFGTTASASVRELLALREITLHLECTPVRFEAPALHVEPAGRLEFDRVVALARLYGPELNGFPQDAEGFVTADAHGRVHGLDAVYAAGDITSFPVKQGGIAAQQADAAAAAIARRAGAPVKLAPFQPVVRGQLLTGMFARFLRAEHGSGTSRVSTEPMWWPPAKIAGRHLAPFLATRLGLAEVRPPSSGIPVDTTLAPGM
jgi:sulfide:quinone oxidoreductase